MDGFGPLMDLFIRLGPYGLFAFAVWVYKNERDERIATQKSFNELSKSGIDAMNEVKNSIRDLTVTLFDGRRGGHVDRPDH